MSEMALIGSTGTAWASDFTSVACGKRLRLEALTTPPAWIQQRRYAYGASYARPGAGILHIFEMGAVVLEDCRGLEPALVVELEGVLGSKLLRHTAETYTVSVDPVHGDAGPRVGWDRVLIPERRPELLAAVALLLAQSAALERYEQAVDTLVEAAHDLCGELVRAGRLPFGSRSLLVRAGRLTGDRLELARWFFLVDRPEETWEDPRIAQLYDELFSNLELRQRHEAVLHKLAAAERATQLVIDLWHGRRSHALEWAIILLIAVEIVMAVVGLV